MLRYYPVKGSCLALVSLPFLTGCSDKAEMKKPNIVLIMEND
jgi:hypothetical protein